MKKDTEITGSFDSLYKGVITKLFNQILDNRADNSSYDLVDSLKSGFAIYSLKCASLFSFRKRSKAEDHNLKAVYGIEKIPSDNGLRKMLDKVDPEKIREGFHGLFERIRALGILPTYWSGHTIVSIDGVEHFCSKTVSCPQCLERKHRDGTTSYYHSMLSAAIVHPDKKEVFVLDNEPIVKQDGSKKNDCERNAAKRLFAHLKSLYSNELIVFVLDALYACAPIIRLISPCWQFVIGIKPAGNKYLFAQFEGPGSAVNSHRMNDKEGEHLFEYVNDLALNASNTDVRVNMLRYRWSSPKGEEKVFTWITSIKLSKPNLYKVMRMGRSRWKIENETFNTLKNQGYHFEHNFGHGKDNLCTVFAYLMMLSFCVDQIQQSSSVLFQKVLEDLKTRVKLWESLRAAFKILPCKNMTEVFFCIADMYQIKLE